MTRRQLVCPLLGILLFHATFAWAQAQDTVIYYHTDAIGSVRMITDANGQVVARYDYAPFGQPWDPPPNPDVRQFAGKERDAETEFNYFGARYYASGNGRFTTVDPVLDIENALEDPQQWNRYVYVRNNPLRHVDPDGRQGIAVTWYQRILASSPAVQRLSNLPIVQQAETLSFTLGLKLLDLLGRSGTQELLKGGLEVATGADAGPLGLLPAISASTVERALATAAETGGRQATMALRALASHIDRGQEAFQGLAKTEETALGLIRAITRNPNRVSPGKKTVDIYDAYGRGVRLQIDTGKFITFLDEAEATR